MRHLYLKIVSKALIEKNSEGQHKRFSNTVEREKQSAALLKYFEETPDACERVRQRQRDYYRSPDARKQNSLSKKKYFEAPEAHEKSSKAQIRRYEDPLEHKKSSDCHRRYFAETPGACEKNSKALKRYFRENPDAGRQISLRLRRFYIEVPDARVKNSVALKKYWSSKEVRERWSCEVALAYAEGRRRSWGYQITGYYRDTHYFRSSYEYRVMKLLDILKIQWTEKTRIVIPWYNPESGRISGYPPDFLVDDNEIWETKGFVDEKGLVLLKIIAACEYAKEHKKVFRILFDKDIVELERRAAERLDWSYSLYFEQVRKELLYYQLKNKKRRSYSKSLRNIV